MRHSDSLTNIGVALAKVQAEIKNPIKNQKNGGVMGNPLYANLEDTLQDYVRPVCTKYGISVLQSVSSTDEAVGVSTMLLHESGEWLESDPVYCKIVIPTNSNGRPTVTQGQATGINITYLRRYSLNAMLGINGDKDTDGSYEDLKASNTAPSKAQAPAFTLDEAKALIVKVGNEAIDGKTLYEVYKAKDQISKELVQMMRVGQLGDEKIKIGISLFDAAVAQAKAQKVADNG